MKSGPSTVRDTCAQFPQILFLFTELEIGPVNRDRNTTAFNRQAFRTSGGYLFSQGKTDLIYD